MDDKIYNELKQVLEKFNGKIKLKNGRYGILEEDIKNNNNANNNNANKNGKKDIKFKDGNYDYIHGNKLERFKNNKLCYEGDFIQEGNNKIYISRHGKGKYYIYENIYNGEFFYDFMIGRGKINNDRNNKFYFFENEFSGLFGNEKKNDINNTITYEVGDEHITLEMNQNNLNIPVRILVKDINNIDIIYEITAKMTYNKKLNGTGFVRDYRTGEILIVNFGTKNIITNELDHLEVFINNEEFTINKLANEKILAKDVIRNTFNNILKNEDNIEYLADIVNKILAEEKIEILGIRDQGANPECWVHALPELIYITNSRIYGREVVTFKQIYDHIIENYGKCGKTDEEIEKIMEEELPNYYFSYKKIKEEEINNYLKDGIQCLLTFDLNNKQWDNFSDYFKHDNIKQEIKILTKEILERPNKKEVDKPDDFEGHAVVIKDIDENGNYIIVNSWGEEWGDKGIFRAKKDCFQNPSIYAMYYTINNLPKEDKDNWNKLKNGIKNNMNEMKIGKILKNFKLRCPYCKNSTKIGEYAALSFNCLKCPTANECIFYVDNFEFIADQLYLYDKSKIKSKKNRFDFKYMKVIYNNQE